MGNYRIGKALLAVVLAFSLALPTPGLAFAAQEASSSLAAGSPASLGAADAADEDVDADAVGDDGSDAPDEACELQTQDASADIWDGSVDTSWYDASSTAFTLMKPAQLAGFAAIVNGTAQTADGADIARDTFKGKTVRLGADMQLNATKATSRDDSQRSWTPIGNVPLAYVDPNGAEGDMPHYTDGIFFDGTFDGAGHVVKNLYIYDNQPGSYGGVQGFFANVGGNALIQNVGIDGGYVYGRVAGGLVAISHVTEQGKVPHIIGCFNKANIMCNGSSTRGAGGIFGGEEQYRGSSVEDGVTYDANYHGGAYIANCYNWGTVSHLTTSNCSMGGIAGTGSVQIYGCYNRGRVEPSSIYSGSIAGNLIGTGYLVGQNGAGHPWEGASVVHDSYALSGTIPGDERSLVKLYNLIDATHVKGGVAEQSPAITNENSTDDVKFQNDAWFADADDALSQSFEDEASAGYPVLYWEKGGVRWDINAKDSYGEWVYGIAYIDDQTYTGSAVTPALSVRYYPDEDSSDYILLHEGSDYLVEYANNVNIGQADVTMTGMGRFLNGRTVHFAIIDGSLSHASIDEIFAQWWYGESVEPDVVVRSGGSVLEEGRDYKLEWDNNDPTDWSEPTRAGNVRTATGSVTVKPLDDKFQGEKTASFTILQASTSLQGAGSDSNPIKIGSKADLQYLAYKTHTGDDLALYSTYSYQLTDDIDATSDDPEYKTDRPCDPLFTAWGTQDGNNYSFIYGLGGTFDGAGHTVKLGQTESGVSFDLSPALGFMVYKKGGASATVKNLTIDGSVLCPHGAAAGFLVMGQSGSLTFADCTNKAEVHGDAYYAGGAAGFIVQTSSAQGASLTMTNCRNEGAVSSGAGRAGGFISALGGRSSSTGYANTFTNCTNAGPVKGGQENGAGGFVAAILGGDIDSDGVGRKTLFERCANEATGTVTMTSSGDVGGIVGYSQDAIELLALDRCSNAATIDGAGSGAIGGGLIGRVYNSTEITNCYNTGDVLMRGNWANNGAGLIGYFAAGNNNSTTLLLKNVYATGTFSGPDADSGGLVGNIFLHTTITLDNAYYDSASANRWLRWNPSDEYPNAVSPPVINGQALAMDTGAMKTETFASQLGAAFGPDDFMTPANKGFPVLWPSDRVVTDLGSGGVDVTVLTDPWTYTGAKIDPGVEVQTSSGDVLQEGKDYVVFYASKGDGSTWRAIVQGIGAYTGSVEKAFTVNACPITSCTISPVKSVSYSDVAGLGSTQEIQVTNPAGKAMVEGIDYEVTYAHNDEAGIAYVRIEGLGSHYTGSTLRMFTITPGDLSSDSQVRIENVDEHYPLSTNSDGLYIYEALYANSGYRLKRADNSTDNGDYVRQFYYASGENAGQPVLTPSGNTATSLSKAGTYTAKFMGDAVRVLPDGSEEAWTNGNWTGAAEVTFTYGNRIDQDASITGVSDAYGYTGRAIQVEPALVNTLTDYPMTKDVDYELTYYDATGAKVDEVLFTGKYQLVISGINDWFGEAAFDFEVVSPNYFIDDNAVVEGISSSYQATGEAVTPVPSVVKVAGKVLDPASDYTVSYEDADGNAVDGPTAAGTYFAVIKGAGVYDGVKRVPFRLEEPLITVYVKQGESGAATKAKAFTSDEFKALKSTGDVVSALYCDQSGSNWKVASSDNYVTLDDLLSAAGVKWGADASVTYAGSDGRNGPSYTYAQLQELMFYPSTTATSTDSFGGKKAPFVLSITDSSSSISGMQTAHDVEMMNVKNASSGNAPRALLGVLPGSYADTAANAQSMMGARLINHVVTVTVTLPATPDVTPVNPDPGSDSPASTDVTSVSMYRMYNPNSGEHFYTASPAERNNLAKLGWDYEGVGWNAPSSSNTPVYRLYNPNAGDHHYTTSATERDFLVSVGWSFEGTGWYSDDAMGVPMYRLYNPNAVTGSHHYTSSVAERDHLVSVGWRDEGVGWYGLK